MVAVTGELSVPSEFCALKLKVETQPVAVVHGVASDALNPPLTSGMSVRPVDATGAFPADRATVSGRPAESVQPDSTPGVLTARYVAMLALKLGARQEIPPTVVAAPNVAVAIRPEEQVAGVPETEPLAQ
jgi:hypothetical protein